MAFSGQDGCSGPCASHAVGVSRRERAQAAACLLTQVGVTSLRTGDAPSLARVRRLQYLGAGRLFFEKIVFSFFLFTGVKQDCMTPGRLITAGRGRTCVRGNLHTIEQNTRFV